MSERVRGSVLSSSIAVVEGEECAVALGPDVGKGNKGLGHHIFVECTRICDVPRYRIGNQGSKDMVES